MMSDRATAVQRDEPGAIRTRRPGARTDVAAAVITRERTTDSTPFSPAGTGKTSINQENIGGVLT